MSRTRTQAPPAGLISLATLVVLATGCAAGSRPATGTGPQTRSTSHEAFLARIDKICGHAVAAHAGHPFLRADFDPEHPNPKQLPAIGNYFARYGGLPQTMAALHKLTPPAADAAAWHQLLTVADQMRDNAERQITAARAEDVSSSLTTVHTAQRLTDELNNQGARFGPVHRRERPAVRRGSRWPGERRVTARERSFRAISWLPSGGRMIILSTGWLLGRPWLTGCVCAAGS